MITEQSIEEVKKILVSIYNPLEIYLFGSYAWGIPNEDSDIDIAIIIDEYSKDRHQMLVDGYRALYDFNFPQDLLIYSKKEFDEFSKDRTRLSFKIKNRGKKIYGHA